ncbi:peptidoglycan-binding protein [Candidatus Kaiserbacteria bacterium]|nr:peptidoglycan-binding protein [Candidatus Kaiserbacteria bacterium]
MKKFFLASASVSVAALLLPLAVSAATTGSDVTIDPDVNIQLSGVTVSVSTGGATLASTTIDSTSFTILMGPNSSISMTAPTLDSSSLSAGASFITVTSCSGGLNLLKLVAPATAATTTIVVTPSATSCSSGGGGSGGGGGGGGSVSPTPTPTPTPAATSTATTPTPTPTTATPAAAAPATSSELLALVAQLKSLIALFESLGGVVAPETKALLAAFPAPSANFTRNLQLGMTGADAKALQVWLNGHGYQVAASGPGSSGNETSRFGTATRAALIKFQKAKGITPAAGYFGPVTRAAVNSM